MEDYRSNSHRSRAEAKEAEKEKRMEKAITGVVKTRKKSGTRKLADVFISEDTSNVKQYVVSDLIIPTAKKLFSDIVKDVVDMMLYGDSRRGSNRSTPGSYVSYRTYSDRDTRDDRYSRESRGRSNRIDYDDFSFENRGEAELVLRKLREAINRYGTASVGDLYDIVGEVPPITAYDYGWLNLANATTERLRDGGYGIRLPKALPLE